MKNIFCALIIGLFSLSIFGQVDKTAPKYDLTRPNPKTTAEINSMTRMQEGSEAWNTDTDTMWRYVNGAWIDTGSGSGISNVVEDTSPQLGGNLDVNGFSVNYSQDGSGVTRWNWTNSVNSEAINGGFESGVDGWGIVPSGGGGGLRIDFTDDTWKIGTDAIVTNSDLGSYVDLSSNQSIGGEKTFTSRTSFTNMEFTESTSLPFNQGIGTNGDKLAFRDETGNQPFIFNADNLTGVHTYTLPNINGTIALTSDISSSVGGIVASGNIDVSNTAGSTEFTVTHGLGYSPDISRITVILSDVTNKLIQPSPPLITEVSTTQFKFIIGDTTGDLTVFANWAIFGSDNATPMTGGEIVTSIDTQLGSTDWQSGGSSLPVDDTTALAKDPADNTKQVRFNVDGIAPSTTAVVDVTGDNQFQTSIKVEADGVSNNGSVTITKNDGTTIIGGMSGFGDTDTVEMVNTVSSESISIDGLGNYNLSAFTGGGNLALAVDNSGNIYTTTIGAGTIQSDTTGLGSAAYLPIANLIAWDYSVSTTPPSLSPNGYGIQINAPANLAFDATMDGAGHEQKLIYDDRTADVATITFSNLELGQEIIIYMNRTALPTFSGATMKVIVTGSETFQADTETVLYGFVNPDGEIDYTIKELTP